METVSIDGKARIVNSISLTPSPPASAKMAVSGIAELAGFLFWAKRTGILLSSARRVQWRWRGDYVGMNMLRKILEGRRRARDARFRKWNAMVYLAHAWLGCCRL